MGPYSGPLPERKGKNKLEGKQREKKEHIEIGGRKAAADGEQKIVFGRLAPRRRKEYKDKNRNND